MRAVVLGVDAEVVLAAQAGRLGDAGPQRPADALDELLAEGLGTDAVEQELQPGATPLGAVLVGVAEDGGHALDDLGGLLGRHEDVDPAREAGRVGEPAAHAQIEAARAVGGDRGREGDVVDQPAGAVLGATRDRDLVLARKVRVELVAEEVAVDGLGRGVAVEDLLVADAGERAADDVARDVAAGALRGEPAGVETAEDLRDLLEPDPVDLEALARRAVDDPAAEVLGDRGDRPRLLGGQHALDDLDALHEVAVARVVRVQAVPLQAGDVFSSSVSQPSRAARMSSETSSPSFSSFIRSTLFMGSGGRYPPNVQFARNRIGIKNSIPIGFVKKQGDYHGHPCGRLGPLAGMTSGSTFQRGPRIVNPADDATRPFPESAHGGGGGTRFRIRSPVNASLSCSPRPRSSSSSSSSRPTGASRARTSTRSRRSASTCSRAR